MSGFALPLLGCGQGGPFFVWKKPGTNADIVVRYYDSGWQEDEIAADTDVAPVVVAYNDLLHIFWRDDDTGSIKVLWYS